jgi:hypothetical protein
MAQGQVALKQKKPIFVSILIQESSPRIFGVQ